MTMRISRRGLMQAGAAAALAGVVPTRFALGNTAKVKVGLMLPYSGTYTALGEAITNGFKMKIAEMGGSLGGREVEFVALDDESNPAKGPENASRLVKGEGVDFLVGTVHSGVAMGMLKVTRETGTITVIPNAGANAATGPFCAPNVFRTSFSSWQVCYPMGKVAVDRGLKRVVTITWKYAAGDEMVGAFVENFEANGGEVIEQIQVPFPNTEFQAYLTQIAALQPDAVFTFFAGGGALKFVKDWAAAGLSSIQLTGAGFLTEGLLEAQGAAANGILSTLHYADGLDNPENTAFRAAYKDAFGAEADVYAVQGYDAAQVIAQGMEAVGGDTGAQGDLIAAMEAAKIASPRGAFTFSKAHNPVQDIYLREVVDGQEKVVGVAHAALADPARGCSLM